MKKCCMCQTVIERDDAPVLTMGAVGNPRLLCDECSELLDAATMGKDFDAIEAAMDKIGEKMGNGNPDRATYNIVSNLMAEAAGRAKAIKLGKYDFSKDEMSDELDEDEFAEIPEELLETEEDIAKDKEDEEKAKKFDKVYNIVLAVFIAAFVGILIWRIIQAYFL